MSWVIDLPHNFLSKKITFDLVECYLPGWFNLSFSFIVRVSVLLVCSWLSLSIFWFDTYRTDFPTHHHPPCHRSARLPTSLSLSRSHLLPPAAPPLDIFFLLPPLRFRSWSSLLFTRAPPWCLRRSCTSQGRRRSSGHCLPFFFRLLFCFVYMFSGPSEIRGINQKR